MTELPLKVKHDLKLKVKKKQPFPCTWCDCLGGQTQQSGVSSTFFSSWHHFTNICFSVLFFQNMDVEFKFQKELFKTVWHSCIQSHNKMLFGFWWTSRPLYQEPVYLYHLMSPISPSCLVFGGVGTVLCLFWNWGMFHICWSKSDPSKLLSSSKKVCCKVDAEAIWEGKMTNLCLLVGIGQRRM